MLVLVWVLCGSHFGLVDSFAAKKGFLFGFSGFLGCVLGFWVSGFSVSGFSVSGFCGGLDSIYINH